MNFSLSFPYIIMEGDMFTKKTYILVCHGCGRFHEKESEFLSVPFSIGFDVPNTNNRWSIPALGCPECMATPRTMGPNGKEDRSKHPIANAFDNGMTLEARARANSEFLEWLPKLEARHARA